MTWQRKTVIRILMLVAELIEEDAAVKKMIMQLGQHINVWSPDKK